MAEARISDDDAKNPILSGDQIYSQVWHRGKKLHFAINGVIDVDGDGKSDLQMVRDLVDLNGGVVDAYLGEDGKVNGEITVNTRDLVLGKFPDSATQTGMQKGWQQMIDDAKTNGVEVIKLDKFLNQVGYAPKDRTVTMGPGARPEDFPSGNDNGAASTAPVRAPLRSARGARSAFRSGCKCGHDVGLYVRVLRRRFLLRLSIQPDCVDLQRVEQLAVDLLDLRRSLEPVSGELVGAKVIGFDEQSGWVG